MDSAILPSFDLKDIATQSVPGRYINQTKLSALLSSTFAAGTFNLYVRCLHISETIDLDMTADVCL